MLTNEGEMEKNSVRRIADDNRVRVSLKTHFLAGKQKGQQEQ
jgi:hypothetical protein